jgi:hypothetical protein
MSKTSKIEQIEHTKKALLEALEKSLGVVTTACKLVGIARSTFYEYVKDDPEFAEAVKDINEVTIDFAESQLHKQIKDGNTTATIFYLKTKGKKRGYVEKTEIDFSTDNNEEIPIIKWVKSEDDQDK